MQEPTSSSELVPIRPKSLHTLRPWWLAAPLVAVTATAAGSYWAMSPRSSNLSGMNLLPANSTMAVQVAIDRGDWLRLKQLGTPASRAILGEQKRRRYRALDRADPDSERCRSARRAKFDSADIFSSNAVN